MNFIYTLILSFIFHFISVNLHAQKNSDYSDVLMRALDLYVYSSGKTYNLFNHLYGIGKYNLLDGRKQNYFLVDKTSLKKYLPANILSDFHTRYKKRVKIWEEEAIIEDIAKKLFQLDKTDSSFYLYKLEFFKQKQDTLDIFWSFSHYFIEIDTLGAIKNIEIWDDDAPISNIWIYSSRWKWHIVGIEKPLKRKDKARVIEEILKISKE